MAFGLNISQFAIFMERRKTNNLLSNYAAYKEDKKMLRLMMKYYKGLCKMLGYVEMPLSRYSALSASIIAIPLAEILPPAPLGTSAPPLA